jgi:hypothetical protein
MRRKILEKVSSSAVYDQSAKRLFISFPKFRVSFCLSLSVPLETYYYTALRQNVSIHFSSFYLFTLRKRKEAEMAGE